MGKRIETQLNEDIGQIVRIAIGATEKKYLNIGEGSFRKRYGFVEILTESAGGNIVCMDGQTYSSADLGYDPIKEKYSVKESRNSRSFSLVLEDFDMNKVKKLWHSRRGD